jgi:disulfide bond formation protein DsbB
MARRNELVALLNLLGLLGITVAQLAGYAFQFGDGELPCPLCLLQRVAFAMVAFGFLLNVTHGSHPAHYGIILLSAVFGASVAGRQMLLHIVPGSGSYGSAIFDLHFYTWALLLFVATILATAALLLLHVAGAGVMPSTTPARWLSVVVIAAIVVTAANAVTTFIECGPIECPDNPVSYWLLAVLGH